MLSKDEQVTTLIKKIYYICRLIDVNIVLQESELIEYFLIYVVQS